MKKNELKLPMIPIVSVSFFFKSVLSFQTFFLNHDMWIVVSLNVGS